MSKKQIILLISLCIAMIVFTFCGWLLFSYLRRWTLIRIERESIGQTRQDLVEYQELGFDENAELIAVLKKRLQHQKMRKRAIKYQWKVVEDSHMPSDHTSLQNLFDVNKKMLAGYVQDIQEYRRLGVSASSDIIRFSYDKMVRLMIALSELERQIAECSLNESGLDESLLVVDGVEGEFGKRVRRMKEIAMQSITKYKDALRVYYNDDVDKQDPHIQFIRMQLTARIKEVNQLDTMKVKY